MERSGRGPGICLEGLRSTTKNIIVAGLRADIWTQDLPMRSSRDFRSNDRAEIGLRASVLVSIILLTELSRLRISKNRIGPWDNYKPFVWVGAGVIEFILPWDSISLPLKFGIEWFITQRCVCRTAGDLLFRATPAMANAVANEARLQFSCLFTWRTEVQAVLHWNRLVQR
jgi:hypothetical protein